MVHPLMWTSEKTVSWTIFGLLLCPLLSDRDMGMSKNVTCTWHFIELFFFEFEKKNCSRALHYDNKKVFITFSWQQTTMSSQIYSYCLPSTFRSYYYFQYSTVLEAILKASFEINSIFAQAKWSNKSFERIPTESGSVDKRGAVMRLSSAST